MTDTTLIAALDRLADGIETLGERMGRVEQRLSEVLAAITDPDQDSPVADALHDLGEQVAGLEETQAALVPGVNEVVAVIRARAQQRTHH